VVAALGIAMVVVGCCLTAWAAWANPEGTCTPVGQVTKRKATGGPYALMAHPMYLGMWLILTGLAAQGGTEVGLAVGLAAAMILEDWITRERLP